MYSYLGITLFLYLYIFTTFTNKRILIRNKTVYDTSGFWADCVAVFYCFVLLFQIFQSRSFAGARNYVVVCVFRTVVNVSYWLHLLIHKHTMKCDCMLFAFSFVCAVLCDTYLHLIFTYLLCVYIIGICLCLSVWTSVSRLTDLMKTTSVQSSLRSYSYNIGPDCALFLRYLYQCHCLIQSRILGRYILFCVRIQLRSYAFFNKLLRCWVSASGHFSLKLCPRIIVRCL